MSEWTSIIPAFLTGVAGPIIVMFIKNYLDKKNQSSDMIKDAVEIGNLISSKIEYIKSEFNGDRVWVAQFHNGGNFYPTGKSIAKFSIFYETVNVGVTSIQNSFQNIPVNLFAKSVNELVEKEIVQVPDFKDSLSETYGLEYVAETSGCKSVYLFAIKTIDDKFIGILGIDFTKRKTKLDTESVNYLSNHATAIGGVLMTHLNKTK